MPVIDFDAARAEQKAEPLILKIHGREFELPASLPASVVLDLIRVRAVMGDDAEVPVGEVDKLTRALLGPGYDEIVAGLTLPELQKLLETLFTAYAPGNRQARRARKARSGSR